MDAPITASEDIFDGNTIKPIASPIVETPPMVETPIVKDPQPIPAATAPMINITNILITVVVIILIAVIILLLVVKNKSTLNANATMKNELDTLRTNNTQLSTKYNRLLDLHANATDEISRLKVSLDEASRIDNTSGTMSVTGEAIKRKKSAAPEISDTTTIPKISVTGIDVVPTLDHVGSSGYLAPNTKRSSVDVDIAH